MVVRIADLMAAEEALDQALAALAEHRDPDRWAAHESVDEVGHRTLHLSQWHLRQGELLEADVRAAEGALRALQRSWGA